MRETPSNCPICSTVCWRSSYSRRATARCSTLSFDGDRAVPDDLPLELSQSPEQVEHRPTAGRGCVDALAQRTDPDAALAQRGDDVDEVAQRPAEAVQAPHHQGVPRAQRLKNLVQLRAALQRPGRVVVQVRQHPAAVNSSTCSAAFCSDVETRA